MRVARWSFRTWAWLGGACVLLICLLNGVSHWWLMSYLAPLLSPHLRNETVLLVTVVTTQLAYVAAVVIAAAAGTLAGRVWWGAASPLTFGRVLVASVVAQVPVLLAAVQSALWTERALDFARGQGPVTPRLMQTQEFGTLLTRVYGLRQLATLVAFVLLLVVARRMFRISFLTAFVVIGLPAMLVTIVSAAVGALTGGVR